MKTQTLPFAWQGYLQGRGPGLPLAACRVLGSSRERNAHPASKLGSYTWY